MAKSKVHQSDSQSPLKSELATNQAPLLEAKVAEPRGKFFMVPITKAEIERLYNAVRALNLMREANDADSEQPLAIFGVLLDNFESPAWEVVNDLWSRFRDEELRASAAMVK